MCILIAKAAAVRKMTAEEIKNSAQANPDGFGMAYVVGDGKIHVHKTFNVDEIIKLNDELPEWASIIYHFRIATHGSVNLANCHPFLDEERGVVFGHNGILHIKNFGDMTDSETAFRYLLAPNIQEQNIMQNAELDIAVDAIIDSSKFAIMNTKGEVKTYGQFIDEDGLLFSNTTYKSYVSKFGYGGYNWEDWGDWGCYDGWGKDPYNEPSELKYYEDYEEAWSLLYKHMMNAKEKGNVFGKKSFKKFKKECKDIGLDTLDDTDFVEIFNDVLRSIDNSNEA